MASTWCSATTAPRSASVPSSGQASGSSPSSSAVSATAPTSSKPRGRPPRKSSERRLAARPRPTATMRSGRRPATRRPTTWSQAMASSPAPPAVSGQRPQGHVHPGDLEQHRGGEEQERRGEHHAHGAHGEGAGELAAIPAGDAERREADRADADGDGDRGARQAARHPVAAAMAARPSVAQVRGGPAAPANRHGGDERQQAQQGGVPGGELTWGASTGSGVPSRAVSAAAIGAITRFRRGARTSDGPVEKNQRHTTALSGGVNRKVRPCSLDPPVGGLDHRTGDEAKTGLKSLQTPPSEPKDQGIAGRL